MHRFSSPQGALSVVAPSSAVGAPQEEPCSHSGCSMPDPTPLLWGDFVTQTSSNCWDPALQNHEQLCSRQTSRNYGSLSLLTR